MKTKEQLALEYQVRQQYRNNISIIEIAKKVEQAFIAGYDVREDEIIDLKVLVNDYEETVDRLLLKLSKYEN